MYSLLSTNIPVAPDKPYILLLHLVSVAVQCTVKVGHMSVAAKQQKTQVLWMDLGYDAVMPDISIPYLWLSSNICITFWKWRHQRASTTYLNPIALTIPASCKSICRSDVLSYWSVMEAAWTLDPTTIEHFEPLDQTGSAHQCPTWELQRLVYNLQAYGTLQLLQDCWIVGAAHQLQCQAFIQHQFATVAEARRPPPRSDHTLCNAP
ncbi:hypothetical protein EMCRGX_G002536 [Ephydatia muelleri]